MSCLASKIGNCLVSGVVPHTKVDPDSTIDKAAVGESLLYFAQRPLWIAHLKMPLRESDTPSPPPHVLTSRVAHTGQELLRPAAVHLAKSLSRTATESAVGRQSIAL